MSKKRIHTGYAIVSKTILDDETYKKGRFGISLSDRDLETCKRYCRKDQIVVRTYLAVLSKSFTIKWIVKYPCFGKSNKYATCKYIQLWHLRIELDTKYTDGYERDIVYEKEV
jgi:hypothetical protein